MDNMIDWNGKLEAVHRFTGDTVDVELTCHREWPDDDGDYQVRSISKWINWSYFQGDGHHKDDDCPWTIRNKLAAAVASVGGDEEWGPAIEVGGVRPEWLDEKTKVDIKSLDSDRWYSEGTDGLGVGTHHIGWYRARYIRLPANHPHYRTETPAEAPLGVLTGVEALERYEGLLRRIVERFNLGTSYYSDPLMIEARALLPKPVDPDLVEARTIVENYWNASGDDGQAGRTRVGYADGESEVVCALSAIKRGRALERGEG